MGGGGSGVVDEDDEGVFSSFGDDDLFKNDS